MLAAEAAAPRRRKGSAFGESLRTMRLPVATFVSAATRKASGASIEEDAELSASARATRPSTSDASACNTPASCRPANSESMAASGTVRPTSNRSTAPAAGGVDDALGEETGAREADGLLPPEPLLVEVVGDCEAEAMEPEGVVPSVGAVAGEVLGVMEPEVGERLAGVVVGVRPATTEDMVGERLAVKVVFGEVDKLAADDKVALSDGEKLVVDVVLAVDERLEVEVVLGVGELGVVELVGVALSVGVVVGEVLGVLELEGVTLGVGDVVFVTEPTRQKEGLPVVVGLTHVEGETPGVTATRRAPGGGAAVSCTRR